MEDSLHDEFVEQLDADDCDENDCFSFPVILSRITLFTMQIIV